MSTSRLIAGCLVSTGATHCGAGMRNPRGDCPFVIAPGVRFCDPEFGAWSGAGIAIDYVETAPSAAAGGFQKCRIWWYETTEPYALLIVGGTWLVDKTSCQRGIPGLAAP